MVTTFTRSHIAEKLIYLDGKPFSLNDYPYMVPIYDIESTEILMKTARQVTKTTTAANLIILDSLLRSHFKTLYITPSKDQTSRFSNTRLTKTLHHSPLIREALIDPNSTSNVFLQVLKNGSEIALSYASDDPDRVRSISADSTFADEIQDIDYQAVIPVIMECMGNSDFGNILYTGTPKSLENSIEHLWQKSSMSEWIMRCTGCKKWQFVDTVKSIGKKGIICLKCGKYLNPREGQWYDFNKSYSLKGFHVSQPIMPRNVEKPKRWNRILRKMESYPATRFRNEVLGISDAVGSRLVSYEELVALCGNYYVELPIPTKLMKGIRIVVGGVDWTGGGYDYVSRTVAWVWGLTEDFRLKTLYFKIFTGLNAMEDVREVARIFTQTKCQVIVGDAGEGVVPTSYLIEKLGSHRVFKAQFGGFERLAKWNKKDRFIIDKTAATDTFMLLLKRDGVIFPNVRQAETPIRDILSMYEQSTTTGRGGAARKVWRHAPTAPDDSLQAMIFGWLAMKIAQGTIEMYEKG